METLLQQYSHWIKHYTIYKNGTVKDGLQFFEVRITFHDNSILDSKERIFLGQNRERYDYHWMDNNNTLIIRWDNAPRHLDVSVYHQHIGAQNEIHASEPMTLAKVLAFIASTIGLLLLFWFSV